LRVTHRVVAAITSCVNPCQAPVCASQRPSTRFRRRRDERSISSWTRRAVEHTNSTATHLVQVSECSPATRSPPQGRRPAQRLEPQEARADDARCRSSPALLGPGARGTLNPLLLLLGAAAPAPLARCPHLLHVGTRAREVCSGHLRFGRGSLGCRSYAGRDGEGARV